MAEIRCLRLKPISVQFYRSSDCKPNSLFSSIIEYQNTAYKSGIIRSKKQKYLSFTGFMWIEFRIDFANVQNYISFKVTSCGSSDQINSSPTIAKEFVAHLPIGELLCVPLNKKKKFVFPILRHAEIFGEAQFKLIITEDNRKFQNSGLDRTSQKAKNSNSLMGTSASPLKQANIFIKPVLSDTSILITPDMFIKKEVVHTQKMVSDFGQSVVEQSRTNRYSDPQQKQMGLLQKFEELNRKFEAWQDENNYSHERSSVWSQEEPSECENESYSYLNEAIQEESGEQDQDESGCG